jgi:hypothetical protein
MSPDIFTKEPTDNEKAVALMARLIAMIVHGEMKVEFFETKLDPWYYQSYSPPPAGAVSVVSRVFYLPVDDKPKEAKSE